MKNLLRFAIVVVLLIVTNKLCFAQQQPKADSAQMAFFNKEFNQSGDWRVEWSERSKVPKIVWGGKIKSKSSKKGKQDKAKDFLKEFEQLFSIHNPDDILKLKRTNRTTLGTEHLDFQQIHKKLRVVGGSYSIHFNQNDEIICSNGSIFDDIRLTDVAPALNEQTAIQYAIAAVGVHDSVVTSSPTAELVIFPTDTSYCLAYDCRVESRRPFADYGVIIDAKTGSTLRSANYICRMSDGIGKVYKIDPRTPAEDVTLTNLDGSGYLSGPYVKARRFISNGVSDFAYSSNLDFRYAPTELNFDQVNVYYHANRFRGEYLTSPSGGNLGTFGLTFPQIQAFTNVWYYTDQGYVDDDAFSNLGTDQIAFGASVVDNYYFNNFAKKNDVIYHEYTHQIAFRFGLDPRNDLYPIYANSLHEGYADYFGASSAKYFGAYNDLSQAAIGEWLYKFNPNHLRTMNTTTAQLNLNDVFQFGYYYNIPGDVHSIGMLLSNTLWDLKKSPAFNGYPLDWLVLMGLNFVHGDNVFMNDVRLGLYVANATLRDFGLPDKFYDIQNSFANRLIGTGATMSGPSTVYLNQSYTWTANPINGGSSPRYGWYTRPNSGSSWQYVDNQNRPSFNLFIGGGTTLQIKCEVTNLNTGIMGYTVQTVSITPPPPLTVSISGPSSLNVGQYGTYTANMSYGTAPYNFSWYYMNISGGGNALSGNGSIKPQLPINNQWIAFGTNSATVQKYASTNMYIRVDVVDAHSQTATTNVYVSVIGGGLAKANMQSGSFESIPTKLELGSNFPNPFNPSTTIRFGLPTPSNVSLKIYNIQGQEVRTLVGSYLSVGYYDTIWDGRDEAGSQVASGIYIYRLQAGNFIQSKKMTYIK
jgi:Zn-dependent metalloprotease